MEIRQNMTNQEKLLSSFKRRNLDKFKEIIKCEDVNVDYFYGEPDNGTLLHLACQSSRASEYVLILLLNGASAVRLRGRKKLTEIFSRNLEATTINYLRVANLLEVTPKEDEFDDTLIRTAVQQNDVDTIRLIAYYCSRMKTVPKSSHLLLYQGSIEAVRVFIEYFDVDMEFQKDSRGNARTHRDIILQKYPQLQPELPTRSPRRLQELLYIYLRHNAPDLFLNRIAELSTEFLNSTLTKDGKTYLHLACEKNYIDVVDALLEKHVRLNTLASDYLTGIPTGKLTPLAVAAYMGHYEIVTKLITHKAVLQTNKGVGSALTFVIRGMNQQGISKDTHREILKLLLTHNSQTVPALDINHKDELGMTPFHLAIATNNEFAFKSLLHAGADLYAKDLDGNIALTLIPSTILENCFDDSINLEKNRSIFDSIQRVTFDYSIFKRVDGKFSTSSNEMEFLYLIKKKPELRTLLNHPLSASFLYVKWCLIKKYYFLNFAFYFSFCVALNAYIFQIHDCPSSPTTNNSSQSTDTGINHRTSSILCNAPWLGLGLITFLFYIVFIFRELCQFLLSKKQYFKSRENWLEMMMIAAVGVFFANQRDAGLAATVNLLSCIELVFLLGKHPWFSIYIEMFKTVALNFAKFLALFSILAISFANSFYILFRDKTKEYISSENQTNVDPANQRIKNSFNLWPDLKVSLIKSIIMMTGELDTSNLPLGENFNYSYVFFSLFVFLVPMVLYNLLNGLAVSDTKAIKKDSEIVAVMSRVKLIWQLERLANSKSLHFFRKLYPEFLNHRFFRDVVIFSRELGGPVRQQQKKLAIHSGMNYSIKFGTLGKLIGKMPLNIIKQAEQIVEKRNHNMCNSVKDMNQSNSGSIDEAVHKMSDQIRNLKLEIDGKIAEMNVRNDEMNANITDRVEKLLQSVERNNKLLECAVQAERLKQK